MAPEGSQKGRTIDRLFHDEIEPYQTVIKLLGAGGAGNNTIHRLIKKHAREFQTIAVNTDAQNLLGIHADRKILIGKNITGGLGAGGDPEIGERSAEESREALISVLEGTDMLFLTGGLGGGTGTGSLPIIGKLARDQGTLTIAIVTLPFSEEGIIRWENAQIGLEKLKKSVDSVIVLRNDKLMELYPNLPMVEAFQKGDELLVNALSGLSDLVLQNGLINLDFADISVVMRDGSNAVIGVGESDSENRAEEAAKRALTHPLFETDITGAQSALIHVSGSSDMTLKEARQVVHIIATKMDPSARILWGVTVNKTMGKTLKVMLIVSGLQIRSEGVEKETDLELSGDIVSGREGLLSSIETSAFKNERSIFDIKESILATGNEVSTTVKIARPITQTTMLFYKIFEEEATGDLKRFDRAIQLLRENPENRRALLDARQACKLLHASAQMFGFDEMGQLLLSIEDIFSCTQSREIQLTTKLLDSVTLAMEMVVDLMENRIDGRGETGYIVDRMRELKEEQLNLSNSQNGLNGF